ncbi:unnamed protein product [Caenorhabditis bovis]|uniref:Uncharacterized protein n=1 Tax=Caenorhabditis bovis TaxID=2654633 RepID=A0A8S1EGJ5_9PELO|nr:unnamed protein product [Caenorhabditis bovis]
MSLLSSFAIIVVTMAFVNAVVYSNEDNRFMNQQGVGTYENFLIVPSEIGKFKRSFGMTCVMTMSGCFTSSQAERYRRYMENVRFIPKP